MRANPKNRCGLTSPPWLLHMSLRKRIGTSRPPTSMDGQGSYSSTRNMEFCSLSPRMQARNHLCTWSPPPSGRQFHQQRTPFYLPDFSVFLCYMKTSSLPLPFSPLHCCSECTHTVSDTGEKKLSTARWRAIGYEQETILSEESQLIGTKGEQGVQKSKMQKGRGQTASFSVCAGLTRAQKLREGASTASTHPL